MTTLSIKATATPLVIGSFVLSAMTGVLMFFHWDSGLNKVVHEWLSWVFLAGAAWHVSVHWKSFRRYWQQKPALLVIGAFVLVLGASFISVPGKTEGKPPFLAPIHAMARAPLSDLAPVLGTNVPALRKRLQGLGFESQSDAQTLEALVGADTRKQVEVLAKLSRS